VALTFLFTVVAFVFGFSLYCEFPFSSEINYWYLLIMFFIVILL
jgi:hypothetical protein